MSVSSVIPSLIYDLQGEELTSEEKAWLNHPASAGIILFQRNYKNIEQLLNLTRSILKENPRLFITVDQEGGRVQRFRHGFSPLPSMRSWGLQYDNQPQTTLRSVRQTASKMAQELQRCGITFSYAPVLDLDYGHSQIIGERSFHSDPQIVTELAQAFVQGMHRQHMCVVGKHFPGHGFVYADSHVTLPIDDRPKAAIESMDLMPFRQLANTLDAVMPAHVVYSAVDQFPPCFSKVWLQNILREHLRFNGVIITDDLNMGAVKHWMSIEDCIDQTLSAGCDFLLMCNNQRQVVRMLEYLEKKPTRDSARKERVYQFISKTKACIQ